MRGEFWSQREIDVIRDLRSQGKSPAYIAKILGRPRVATGAKINRLGLNDCYNPLPKKMHNDEWPIDCFANENVSAETLRKEFAGTPRRLQAPVNHTVGGVAKYG